MKARFFVLLIVVIIINSAPIFAASEGAQTQFDGFAAAASNDGLWTDVAERDIANKQDRPIIPDAYRTVALNVAALQNLLVETPLEGSKAAKQQKVTMSLPLPDGSFGEFLIVESPIMAPELAAKFPEIKTYLGQGIDNPAATVRFDWTPMGFHALILSPGGSIYIDPYSREDVEYYISYYKRDFSPDAQETFIELPPLDERSQKAAAEIAALVGNVAAPSGDELRTYRLAVAATGEYTQFHGGSVAEGLAAAVTTINRVNGVYEREVAVRMVMVANNDQIIYTDGATDPYTNDSGGTMLGQNQTNLDAVIGDANYDIGHVFSTGGGGVAWLGVPCVSGSKARGVTGRSSPVGDPFDIDYVAHEIGHQYGANHTFNGNAGSCAGNGNVSTAYEPGSGTTIMAYAGICSPQNTQSNSDDYFHTASFDEIVAYTTAGSGNACPVVTSTGNTPPVVDAGTGGFTIPADTPFILTGSATDADGHALVYRWEEFDLGPAGHPNSPSGNAPLFRSFSAVSSPRRTFPQMSDIVNNTQTMGEILPGYSRTLTFRLTALDNQAGGGGVDYNTIAFSADASAGPFLLTAPNTAVAWAGGSLETVSWNVANTDATPVSCANVDIHLSTDGGYTYPILVAANTPNDGSQTVTVPNLNTNSARMKVACANNIFFDISNSNFSIAESAGFFLSTAPDTLDICLPGNAVYTVTVASVAGYADPVTLAVNGHPGGSNAGFSDNPLTPAMSPVSSTLTISNLTAGNYAMNIIGVAPTSTHTSTVTLNVFDAVPGAAALNTPANGAADVSVTPTFSWSSVSQAAVYTLEVATDTLFSSVVYSATITGSTLHTMSLSLDYNSAYYWRVTANNYCGSGVSSSAFSFITLDSPPVLLVDDDDNAPDVRSYYTTALNSLGVDYDIWNTGYTDSNEPDAADLAPYQAVIWYTGDSFNSATGPGANGEAALSNFLDSGNCLLMSSQDYLWAKGGGGSDIPTTFMQTYLGLAGGNSDVKHTQITGSGSVFGGLGPYNLAYPPLSNFSDDLTPDASSELAFSGNAGSGNAAIAKDSGVYKTAWLGFPFEAVPTAADREDVMNAFLDWCPGALSKQTFIYLPLVLK